MKNTFTSLMMMFAACGTMSAQVSLTGPNSSQSPYLFGTVPTSTMTSILTAGDVVGGYTLAGLGDGLGAFDNGDQTFTLLMNHEMSSSAGTVHAHGMQGAFVSRWVINKNNLSVVSGNDLIQNVYLWANNTYTMFNAANPSPMTAFGRFCAAELAAPSAFYNSTTGLGSQERIFLNGEESGAEGRAFAHIATGPAAGNTYQLPHLGRCSWENAVASPYMSNKTIVVGLDDATPGQVYIYVGNKSNTGNDIERAGLFGGNLYGVAVTGMAIETSTTLANPNTPFTMVNLGQVQNTSGSVINSTSNNLGVTAFLRPEDGAWDPNNPNDFYFVTTNSFNAPSRMWRLRFYDINNPEFGGTITAVLDGSENQRMLDNAGMDGYGNILLQEDPGGQTHTAKIWQYNIATDALTLIADHDPNRFISGGPNFLTQDEESSGIIDVQSILGPGWFIFYDQAHYSLPSPVVDGGQLLAFYNPASAAANPEINIASNNNNIVAGDSSPAANDNTSFGLVNTGTSKTNTFVIQNAGPGALSISAFSLTGADASSFSLLSPPSLPATLAVNGAMTLSVNVTPQTAGVKNATLHVFNNDANENQYAFAIQAEGAVAEINLLGSNTNIADGATTPVNNNNTDFGFTLYNNVITKIYNIQNTGNGTLTVSSINLFGNSEFTPVNLPSLPLNLAGGASATFAVQYYPMAPGTHTAVVNIQNSDADETLYNYHIKGVALMDVGVEELSAAAKSVNVYPNPANTSATLIYHAAGESTVDVLVFDLQSKLVMNRSASVVAGENKIELETASLSAGEYLIQVKSKDQTESIKLLIAR